MTRRPDTTKSTIPKKDRREQNRINQKAFRERKRKEFEDLRAELDSVKASQPKTPKKQPLCTSIDLGLDGQEQVSRAVPPLETAENGILAVPEPEYPAQTTIDLHTEATFDPSLLSLPSMNADASTAPNWKDDTGSYDLDAAYGAPPLSEPHIGYTHIPRFGPDSPLLAQASSFNQMCDITSSASYNSMDSTLSLPKMSLGSDPLASMTADYVNAQLLAFKSAEWYAKAAEVGVKIATFRHNAWLGTSSLWPQWSLGDANHGLASTGTGAAVGFDPMVADPSAQMAAPQLLSLHESVYPVSTQDWQRAPLEMPHIVT